MRPQPTTAPSSLRGRGQRHPKHALAELDQRRVGDDERTLPVLESAHIKPVGDGGRHATDNGLFLRSDVHRLFDSGYVTVTSAGRFRVSGRIKQEYDNGEEYYALDGSEIRLPRDAAFYPRKEFLEWHADTRFLG